MSILSAFRIRGIDRRSSAWRGHVLIAFVFLFAVLLAATSFFAHRSATERGVAEQRRAHAMEVLQATDELKIATLSMVRGERGYVISGKSEFLQPYLAGQPNARAQIALLRSKLADSPEQIARLDRVEAEFDHYSAWSADVIALKRRSLARDAVAQVALGEARLSLDSILGDLRRIEAKEQEILARHALAANQRASENEMFQYCLSIIGITLISLCVLATGALKRAVDAEAATRAELRRLASTDELTGTANRREFMQQLQRSIEHAQKRHELLAVAIFDIDHFKRVNDRYGHPAGDAVIRTVAAIALDTVRAQDIVGRIGGEEFAIILPDCTPGDAYIVCERLRIAVQQADLEMETGEPIFVTLSTGLASIVEGDDARGLIARADRALYDAKNNGRDRVLMAA
ncbi:diguanylate cyclase [Erythrobacter sp. JK5]|uniref:GGDEF domain-containing protein n=1 Tax=Erythrobacter sp. JK5 TaxID=2829500 RepID=UPI001BA735B7|nr:diguanylate cyclase [Erythrobacter sp. JK5]QUL38893.1 diguanylate cyclase [Erythrobacter sp. JK5]